ncbi:MAG TPA: sulfatase-like hydrolase/transferase [Xanthobacteraceae bacterium]
MALVSLSRVLRPNVRPQAAAGTALLAAVHLGALALIYATEYTFFGVALSLLAWGFLNFVWLLLVRRPGLAAAISLVVLVAVVALSRFKFDILWITASFLDILIIDADTVAFLLAIFPQVRHGLLAVAVLAVPLAVLIWRLDPFRVRAGRASFGGTACFAGLVALATAVPEQPWEPFQGVNHVSNFARSGVASLSELMRHGWMDAARALAGPPLPAATACQPARKPPHIIALLDESSFDVTAAPGIVVPPGYDRHFRSFDGAKRGLVVEATGGPTWYSEYNLLTGLSARSFGRLMFHVTRIAAGHVERGLPLALRRCGYTSVSLYPTYGDFLSARRFQVGVGIDRFIDQTGMGAPDDMQPDRFYLDHAARVIARERAAPLFVFAYVTANHFPWTTVYRPELTPDWRAPGNGVEIDEYIRRQTLSARDYADFRARLAREFPDDSFLVVRFGDHQPTISAKMLDPALEPAAIARRIKANDPRYFTTYYAIDAINFTPASMASARDGLEAAYLPLVILEAAGIALDPSFVEQKKILQRCGGVFYACDGGAEARRFNRLLMDAGLIKGF